MKRTLISITILFLSLTSYAQSWQTNFEEAQQEALRDNKKIILVFSGSDWCGPCIKLEKQIWESDYFKAYAKEHYVLLRANFPRLKKNKLSKLQQEHNNRLAETYNPRGYFPYVVVLDKNANALGSTGYKKVSPEDYVNYLEKISNDG